QLYTLSLHDALPISSGVASGSGAPQHLGTGAARCLLEICGASQDRRRKAGLVYAEGQQFFPASGKRQRNGRSLGRRQEVTGTGTPRPAHGSGESPAHDARRQVFAPRLWRGVSRRLSCGADSPPAAFAGTLRKKTENGERRAWRKQKAAQRLAIRDQGSRNRRPQKSRMPLRRKLSESANYGSHVRGVLKKANGGDARRSGRKTICGVFQCDSADRQHGNRDSV